MRAAFVGLVAIVLIAGCTGGKQPAFAELHPVTGVVNRGGAPVKGGAILFAPETDAQDFLINSEVGPDGKFSLSTVRTTDSRGERKSGAPAGKYRVSYSPPLGDQTAGGSVDPIAVPNLVTVQPGSNTLTIELPKK